MPPQARSGRLAVVSRPKLVAALCLLAAAAPSTAAAKVNYGPISHKGLHKVGATSTSLKLGLQIGLVANNSGVQKTAKSASNPSSSSYGKYLSLSKLQSKYGATSSVRKGVVNAFKSQSITAKVDVTHLRASATMNGRQGAEDVRDQVGQLPTSSGAIVALPVNTPKPPKGLQGNVDTIAGMRLTVKRGRRPSAARRAAAPLRRRHPDADRARRRSCVDDRSRRLASRPYPNQILEAYGIASLHAAGLLGQGTKLAIVGEAPTPASDVNQYRNCFGAEGTALKIHNGSGIKPILESSLDAMVVSMVASEARAVRPLGPPDQRGRRRRRRARLPEDAGVAAPGDHQRRAAARRGVGVIRRVRVDRLQVLGVPHAGHAPAGRRGGARDHGRGGRGRHGLVRVRARRAAEPAHVVRQEAAGVLARQLGGGCWRWAGRT